MFLMLSGVVLGAFGAHGLKAHLSDYGLEIYHTAVFYHFVHGLGLLVVCGLAKKLSQSKMNMIGSALFTGVLIFSGSLYVLAITEIKWLGMLTPIGGLFMIIGWGLCLAWLPASQLE